MKVIAVLLALVLVVEGVKLREPSSNTISVEVAPTGSIEDPDAMSKKELSEYMTKKSAEVFAVNHQNLCARYLGRYLNSEEGGALTEEDTRKLLHVVIGLRFPETTVGIFLHEAADYERYGWFLKKIILKYHRDSMGMKLHYTNWKISDFGDKGTLDFQKLGIKEQVPMRIRVTRNIKGFKLSAGMSKTERIALEITLLPFFESLTQNPNFGGRVYSLTPGDGGSNPYAVDETTLEHLVTSKKIFENPTKNRKMAAAGIANDYPYGRGVYLSATEDLMIWYGEEDHLRIVLLDHGTELNAPFLRLRSVLDTLEDSGIQFEESKQYGYISSCPSNLGTGMHASVKLKLPNLTKKGSLQKAIKIAAKRRLNLVSAQGFKKPVVNGEVFVSNAGRLFVSEREIVANLYNGVSKLMKAEAKAA
eukprot:GHVN01098601.1.p1 GENE.GHVN01098601.1~~GHVN01098601.1.p1  ORF type:complete len:419 (+),score=28.04 GHVN01098601.1:122-1378(+)